MMVREATTADALAVAAIRERTIRTVVAPLGLYTPEAIEAWAGNYDARRVEGFIAEGNFLVADEGDRVVGYGRLRMQSPDLAVIRGVFVDADRIGRGIGGAILRSLLGRGSELGARDFELVATLNARSFYERHGFRCLEEVRHQTPNGAVIPGLRMRRDAALTD